MSWAYAIRCNCLHMFSCSSSEMIPSLPDDVRWVNVDTPASTPPAVWMLLFWEERHQTENCQSHFLPGHVDISSVPFWVGHSGALLMFLSSNYTQSKAFSGKILHLKKIQEVHKCIYTWTPSSPATTTHTDQYRATSFTWKLIWEYTSPTSASSIFLSRLPQKSAICTIIIHIVSMSTQWRDSLSALEMPPRK